MAAGPGGRRRKEPLMGGKPNPLRTYMWCSPCGSNHVPGCSFLLGGKECTSYNERQIALRDRIRAITPRLNERERVLFGLVWLQLDLLDDLGDTTAHWTLDVLGSLVTAFETLEAPSTPEPP